MNFTLSMKISGRLLKCMKRDFCCCLFGICLVLFPCRTTVVGYWWEEKGLKQISAQLWSFRLTSFFSAIVWSEWHEALG